MVMIFGDFNCPTVDWVKDNDNKSIYFPSNCKSNAIYDMFTFLFSNNLDQLNYVLNFQNKLLDLVFVSNSDSFFLYECNVPLLPIDQYHKPIEIILDVSVRSKLRVASNEFYNFKRANFFEINKFLMTADWDLMHTHFVIII